jgi:peptidoglycan/xylan/chitin deacetylase (PgdA/CDA1 family)
MSPVTVLMYHAISANSAHCAGADSRYAVSEERLARHLDGILASGRRLASVEALMRDTRDTAAAAITFDDGHCSNARAVEQIAARDGSADLFINPARIGTRHFLSWPDLRRFAQAGFSIQSHGQTHRYLDELTSSEVEIELLDSKHEIEQRLGRAVTLFAPPGGRESQGLLRTAHRLGYRAVCSSRAGLWRATANRSAIPEIPRLAVLATTPDAQLYRWVEQSPAELARQRLRHSLLWAAKQTFGNERYERLRGRLLA